MSAPEQVIARVACLLVVATSMVWGREPTQAPAPRLTPWIELKAPGGFDAGALAPRASASYRVDATVLIPLFSIPVAHRNGVGFVTAAVRDLSTGQPGAIRSYEVFGASLPERARGLNRLGFFREAVGRGPEGEAWTAHFGALSSSPETSREQVEVDGDESVRLYTVLDGLTDRRGSSNRDVRVELTGSWVSSTRFYEQILPVWRLTEPETETRTTPAAGIVPLGFLAVLEHALLEAATGLQTDGRLDRAHHPFVHKAQPMTLERRHHAVDDDRARDYAELGLVAASATVHRIEFRLVDRQGDQVQSFRVWIDPGEGHGARAGDVPMPLGFEFKPKSFLRLEGVRRNADPSR